MSRESIPHGGGFQNPLARVLERLENVRRENGGWKASCPVPGHGQGRGDLNPSLRVGQGDDGRALLKCRVGCSQGDVLNALGLEWPDLYPPANGNGKKNGHRKPVEAYDYTDEAGKLLFQCLRYEGPKDFSQRRPDGAGGWVWKGIFENGTRPVLYRLPDVLRAVREGRPVWVVEGEKDVHRLERIGLTATTNPMGAGKWRDHLSDTLVGADVRIVPDNDGPGRDHARQVARSLRGKARDVRIVKLPGLQDGGDVSDWLSSGGTTEELERQVSLSSSLKGNDGDDTPRDGLDFVSFASMERPGDERPFVVRGLVPQRFPTILYGDGGTAKSMIAASLLMDVTRGAESWMGHEIGVHGPTAYLDFELDAEEQARRVYQLAEGLGLDKPPKDFYYLSAATHPAGEVLVRALENCKRHGVVLVLIDSLGFALDGDAEASRDVLGFYRRYIEPFREAGITVLVVDHQSKLQGGEKYHQKSPFGSVFKKNGARSVIQVEAVDQREGELTVRFRHNKANFAGKFDPFEVVLIFHKTKVAMRHRTLEKDEIADEDSLSAIDKVRLALKDGPAYPDELENVTGLALGTVKNALTKLRKKGEIGDTGKTNEKGATQVTLLSSPSSPSSPLSDDDSDTGGNDGEDDPVTAYLNDPPRDLVGQLGMCRENERLIKPTCSAIAFEVYRTASRWAEVEPVLRRYLGRVGA
ncbi:MAG: AAA family ATPase [Actinomycetota bacterium]|nr:AAA family ATPase [Actinomycetota bacterium]